MHGGIRGSNPLGSIMTAAEKCEAILKALIEKVEREGSVTVSRNITRPAHNIAWEQIVDNLYRNWIEPPRTSS